MASESLAARPYARAVFELATEQGDFDRWSNTLGFWSAVVQDPDVSSRLADPGMTAPEKAALIEQVSEGLDDNGRNLLHLLAENERLSTLTDIATEYEHLRGEAEGVVEAHVVSAYALDDAQTGQLTEALGKRLERKVKLTSEVDESLIGGAIVRAGDLVIDGSIRGRLAGLERSIVG